MTASWQDVAWGMSVCKVNGIGELSNRRCHLHQCEGLLTHDDVGNPLASQLPELSAETYSVVCCEQVLEQHYMV